MIFRWTLTLILVLMGGSLIGNALLFYPSLVAIPYRIVAVVLGALVLGGGIILVARRRVTASRSNAILLALQDGFTVFGLGSLVFNTLMMALGKCDLDPTFDVVHLIPIMLINEVWEGLISASGGSFLLTTGGIALFDACIGILIALVLYPFRRFLPQRTVWTVILLFCFAAFEASVIRWMEFRC